MTPPLHPQGIPDADVPQLFARAAAIDAEIVTHMPLTRLREIAQEAGVSDAALAAALEEYAGRVAMSRPKPLWRRMIVANGATLFIGGAIVMSAARLAQLAGGDLIVGPAMCLGLLASAAVAHRARATAMRVVSLGLAIAMGSELLLSLTQGSIHGRSAHFALILGSVLGVAVGGLAIRRGDAKPPHGDQLEAESLFRRVIRRSWSAWRQGVSPMTDGTIVVEAFDTQKHSAPAV